MIVTLTIPDATYQKYASYNSSNPRQALQKQIERFEGVDSSERAIILQGEPRKAIEKLVGTTIESPEALAEAFIKALSISIEGGILTLKLGQVKRFAAEAAFYKRDIKEFLLEKIQRAVDDAFGGY